MSTETTDTPRKPNHPALGLPHSGLAWAGMLLSVLALVIGFASSPDTLSRWIPGILGIAGVWMGLRAGIVRDEHSVFMWVPVVFALLYLFLLLLMAMF